MPPTQHDHVAEPPAPRELSSAAIEAAADEAPEAEVVKESVLEPKCMLGGGGAPPT